MSGLRVPWATTERVLVCVGPSPTSARIIRSTKRLAASLGAEWIAVAVDSGVEGPRSAAIREQTAATFAWPNSLAQKLGHWWDAMWRTPCFSSQRHGTSRRSSSEKHPNPVGSARFLVRSRMSYWSGPATLTSMSSRAKEKRPLRLLCFAGTKPVAWTQYSWRRSS